MKLGCFGCLLMIVAILVIVVVGLGVIFLSTNIFSPPEVRPVSFTKNDGYAAQQKLFEVASRQSGRSSRRDPITITEPEANAFLSRHLDQSGLPALPHRGPIRQGRDRSPRDRPPSGTSSRARPSPRSPPISPTRGWTSRSGSPCGGESRSRGRAIAVMEAWRSPSSPWASSPWAASCSSCSWARPGAGCSSGRCPRWWTRSGSGRVSSRSPPGDQGGTWRYVRGLPLVARTYRIWTS